MGWKENWSGYFEFSRKDRIAVITLVVIISFILYLPEVMPGKGSSLAQSDTSWIAALERLEKKGEDKKPGYQISDENNTVNYQYDRPSGHQDPRQKGELFYFDPNNLTEAGWKKLGLRDKTIRTILNYTAKGGKFRKPEDLQRIYGLFPDEFERIAPYIQIAGMPGPGTTTDPPGETVRIVAPKKDRYTVIDINSADTTAFIALPGIGSKLAARIVNFRDKLGGFYAVEQVAETFGLADSTFQKIKNYLKLENVSLRKININKATADELKSHPYIRYQLANPIIAYRKEHGLFLKLEDLKKVMAVTDEIFRKIAPYLETED